VFGNDQPFIKLPVRLRERLHELTPTEWLVWTYYMMRANHQTGIAFPSTETACADLGIYRDTFSRARGGLVRKKWLQRAGFLRRKDGTVSGVMQFRPMLPDEAQLPAKSRQLHEADNGLKPSTGEIASVTGKNQQAVVGILPVYKKIVFKNSGEEEKTISAAPKEVATPAVPPVILLPLNDRSEHPITETEVAEWKQLYPAVDVLQALRGMRGWLLANKTHRKTRSGILKFATGWLNREQDKARPSNDGKSMAQKRGLNSVNSNRATNYRAKLIELPEL